MGESQISTCIFLCCSKPAVITVHIMHNHVQWLHFKEKLEIFFGPLYPVNTSDCFKWEFMIIKAESIIIPVLHGLPSETIWEWKSTELYVEDHYSEMYHCKKLNHWEENPYYLTFKMFLWLLFMVFSYNHV